MINNFDVRLCEKKCLDKCEEGINHFGAMDDAHTYHPDPSVRIENDLNTYGTYAGLKVKAGNCAVYKTLETAKEVVNG